MRRYLDLMRIDFMTMNGEKNSMRSLMILVFAGSIAGELFLSPMFGYIGILLVGAMSVPVVFNSHSGYHSEKMFGLLPISRKDLVTARFIMFTALYLAMSIVMYIFMELSLGLKIYTEITADFEKMFADVGVNIAYGSFCRLLFFVFFAFGMIAVATSLKGYFGDPAEYETLTGLGAAAKKTKPRNLIILLVFVAGYILMFVFASGAISVSAGVLVIVQLFLQLFTAGDGVLFSIVMITLAGFSAVYNYFCTVLEYDDKDI